MGMTSYERFHFYLGQAIANWQAMEMALYRTFRIAARLDSKTAGAIFYAVASFNTKLQITTRCIAVSGMPLPMRKRWTTIKNRVGRKSEKRNDLAHLPIITFPNKPKSKRLMIMQPFYYASRDARVGDLSKIYDQKRLRETRDEFAKLAREVKKFADDLAAHVASPPKSGRR